MNKVIAVCLVLIVGFLAFDQYESYMFKKRLATSMWQSKCEREAKVKYSYLGDEAEVKEFAENHCQKMVDNHLK